MKKEDYTSTFPAIPSGMDGGIVTGDSSMTRMLFHRPPMKRTMNTIPRSMT